MDTFGIRHLALAMDAQYGDPMLCDVFMPCAGYAWDVLDNCDDVSPVTCLECLCTRFEEEVRAMNLAAIEHLDEQDLINHFIDRGAMAPGFDD